jgi:RNA polymerase sigma-70 factor, ECF subfamily
MTESTVLLRDDELLHQVASGSQQAFFELYQRHSAPVYNYIVRLMHEREEAEDILQEVFMAVWRGAGNYRGQAQVKTWVYRIAHNQAVSWLRRRHPLTILEDLRDEDDDHDPEFLLNGRWEQAQLWQALDMLSPKHRAVVELAFVHEMSYQEIAQVVGCPVGTVKSRMSYALQALTRNLEKKS